MEKLSAKQRRALAEFIRSIDEAGARMPVWVQPRFSRGRRFAELALRLSTSEGTEADLQELRELQQQESPEPWSWVDRSPNAGQQQTNQRGPKKVDKERHQRQQLFGEIVAKSWVGRRGVASLVAAARPELTRLVEPLLMPEEGDIVTLVSARFLGGAGLWPDGSQWPDPFAGAPRELVKLAAEILPKFVERLVQLARAMVEAGASLDPNDVADLLVLAQLTLLSIDLDRPAEEIVAELNVWGPGSVDGEEAARGHVASHVTRHGRNARFQADLTAIAERLAQRHGSAAIRAPYARAGRRCQPAHEYVVERRRDALGQVLREFPDVSAGLLRRTWAEGRSTPGGLLRTILELQPHDPPPGETTLRNDLREIG